MKYIFLNPHSCSGLAVKKWNKICDQLSEVSGAVLIDDFYKMDWDKLVVTRGDSFISAGGDGTLHSMVNALIKNKGIEVLAMIKIGHIGLGSNNSFLRPYNECQVIFDIPMRISDITYTQDLLEIEVQSPGASQRVYCVANSSLGFLASANILFNTAPDIALLKKWNSDLADIYTFIRALFKYRALDLDYVVEGKTFSKSITNMHFMKKPYYATDLGFPEVIAPANGLFRFNLLEKRNALVIIKKFFSMIVLKQQEEGRDQTQELEQVTIKCKKITPIEMDGEIYYGTDFKIRIFKEGIRLCK